MFLAVGSPHQCFSESVEMLLNKNVLRASKDLSLSFLYLFYLVKLNKNKQHNVFFKTAPLPAVVFANAYRDIL